MAKTSTHAVSDDSQWLPLKAAARWLGVSYWTAMKWVRAGTLKTKKSPGKKHMVRRSDMERLYR